MLFTAGVVSLDQHLGASVSRVGLGTGTDMVAGSLTELVLLLWRWGILRTPDFTGVLKGIVIRDDVLVAMILRTRMSSMTWPKAWIPTLILQCL